MSYERERGCDTQQLYLQEFKEIKVCNIHNAVHLQYVS